MPRVTNEIDELLDQLRQAGEEPADDLLERIKAQGAAVVQPLITMTREGESPAGDQPVSLESGEETEEVAVEERPELWVPLHAVRLLGDLHAAEAVEPLLSLLASDDDWLVEDLIEALGRIGEPALAPLRTFVFDRSQSRLTRFQAIRALGEIAENHPELRDEVIAALVARLAPEETQAPDDETLNGMIISELLDLQAREVEPAILQAFDDDRVDLRIVDRNSLWVPAVSVPPNMEEIDRPLKLWLRCSACGYERPHEVTKVLYDLGTMDRRARGEETPYDEIVVAQHITCPKCGAVDQYEITGDARLAVSAHLLVRMAHARETGEPAFGDASEGPLVITRFVVAGDRQMHPYEARDMYREHVAAEPNNPALRVRYGNVLQTIGYPDEAAEQYRAAIELDPANIEAENNLGVLADKAGQRDEARQHFQRVVELAPQSRMPREEQENYLLYARSQLGLLPPSLAASVPTPTVGRWSQPTRPARVASPAGTVRTQKVGRNDPCPCGSGIKYKKCCGR